MVNEKERAAQLERLAPKPTAQEMEEVNRLFRHFLFKRVGRGEIWTTCCRKHTIVKPDTDNADELRVLHAPHTPEPRNTWDLSPTVLRRSKCPYCGAKVTVKELRYSGGRANLWSFRRAVILRQWRGALWATAWDCKKNYSRSDMAGNPVLTDLPEMTLLGVYRFTPGAAEQATRQWWCSGVPMNYLRQTAIGKNNGRKGGMWKIHAPYTYCAELGGSYDVIGLAELGKGFMRWCGLDKLHLPSDDFIELLTAACFYPRQIEWLVKLGLGEAVEDLAGRGIKNAALIRWEAEKPKEFLRCTRQEALDVTEDKSIHRPLDVLKLYVLQKDKPAKMTLESAAFFAQACLDGKSQREMLDLLAQHGVHAEKMMRYLQQAGVVAAEKKGRPVSDSEVTRLYVDYLDAARNCGMDVENPVIFMPRDLITKHDRVTAAWSAIQRQRREAVEAEAYRKKAEAYRKRLHTLTEKYLFWTDDFLIRAPINADEIVDEGKALKHCVGGYADRHLSGATTILFLRRRDRPHTPLATIEVAGNNILQVHGYRNELEGCADNPGKESARTLYAAVLDPWLKWLKGGSKRDKDGRPKLPKKKNRRNAA
nr:MAG TPA: PcfJ like protein [Caudoviricetes sp.]